MPAWLLRPSSTQMWTERSGRPRKISNPSSSRAFSRSPTLTVEALGAFENFVPDPVAFEEFYEPLESYGDWYETDDYGRSGNRIRSMSRNLGRPTPMARGVIPTTGGTGNRAILSVGPAITTVAGSTLAATVGSGFQVDSGRPRGSRGAVAIPTLVGHRCRHVRRGIGVSASAGGWTPSATSAGALQLRPPIAFWCSAIPGHRSSTAPTTQGW